MKNQTPVDFPGNARVHIALAASNLEASRTFYETLLGEKPTKERSGHVKFEPRDPSVNLTLNEVKDSIETPGGPTHFGIQVKTPEEVSDAVNRLSAAGLVDQIEEETACCYAVQDKVWAVDPDGNRWEVFVVLDPDSDQYQDGSSSCCATADTKSETVACC